MFEATGAGAKLITDDKTNLHELFEPGKEAITYRRPADCLEAVRYYTAHEAERKSIAQSGRARTMRDHNYRVRMQELVGILNRLSRS
jgi:spore maturation protein CgeB